MSTARTAEEIFPQPKQEVPQAPLVPRKQLICNMKARNGRELAEQLNGIVSLLPMDVDISPDDAYAWGLDLFLTTYDNKTFKYELMIWRDNP